MRRNSYRPKGEPAPCEEALRALARRWGPSVGKLHAALHSDTDEPDLHVLMLRTATMPHSSERQRAEALWELVQQEIKVFASVEDDVRLVSALNAAFRQPTDSYEGPAYNSIAARHALAHERGEFGPRVSKDLPKKLWRLAVRKLGHRVERRLEDLERDPSGWASYLSGGSRQGDQPSVPPALHDDQEVVMNRLIATYIMRGRSVSTATTERLLTAMTKGVDRYVVRAYSPVAGTHEVKIEPLLNCRAGDVTTFAGRNGGQTHEVPMHAPRPLKVKEQWFLASRVTHQEGAGEDPVVEIHVTNHGIEAGGLTLRVQFDDGFHPRAAWWFDADVPEHRHLTKPLAHERRAVTCSSLGFMQYTFPQACRTLGKYGLAWLW